MILVWLYLGAFLAVWLVPRVAFVFAVRRALRGGWGH